MDEVQDLKSEPEMSPTPPFVSVTPSKGPLGLIIKIVLGLIVILVVGTGVLLGTRIWDPLWNPFRPEPEEVIERMSVKMRGVQTIHSEVEMEFEIVNEILKEEMRILINFGSDLDVTNPENQKSTGSLNAAITIPKTGDISLKAETKMIGETSYLKLDTLEVPSHISFILMMLDIDKMQGQWLKLDREALAGLGLETVPKEQEEKMQEKLQEKVLKLFEEKKVYYVKEELPDEKISGKKVYHYLLSLDREEIKEVIPELFATIMEATEGEMPAAGEFGAEFIAGGLAQSISKFLEKIGGIDFEMWIGKKDGLLYKVNLYKKIEMAVIKEGAKGEAIIKFDMQFSNFNQPVKIEAPEEYVDFKEVIPTILTPFLQPSLPIEIPREYLLPQQPMMQKDSSYLFQASLLRAFLGL